MLDRAILSYELFGGDRDVDIRVLFDRMLVVRKPHDCVVCREAIAAGDRVRARGEVDRDSNQVMTFYACVACCAAMAQANDDAGEAIAARYAYGSDREPGIRQINNQTIIHTEHDRWPA